VQKRQAERLGDEFDMKTPQAQHYDLEMRTFVNGAALSTGSNVPTA